MHSWIAYSPLASQAVAEPVDTVASDAALAQHLRGHLGIDSLQRSERIALNLRFVIK